MGGSVRTRALHAVPQTMDAERDAPAYASVGSGEICGLPRRRFRGCGCGCRSSARSPGFRAADSLVALAASGAPSVAGAGSAEVTENRAAAACTGSAAAALSVPSASGGAAERSVKVAARIHSSSGMAPPAASAPSLRQPARSKPFQEQRRHRRYGAPSSSTDRRSHGAPTRIVSSPQAGQWRLRGHGIQRHTISGGGKIALIKCATQFEPWVLSVRNGTRIGTLCSQIGSRPRRLTSRTARCTLAEHVTLHDPLPPYEL